MVNTDLRPGGGRKLPKRVSSLAKTSARTFDHHFCVPLEVNVLQWIVEQIGPEGRFGENLRGFTTTLLTLPPPSPPVWTTVKGKVQKRMRDAMNVNFF